MSPGDVERRPLGAGADRVVSWEQDRVQGNGPTIVQPTRGSIGLRPRAAGQVLAERSSVRMHWSDERRCWVLSRERLDDAVRVLLGEYGAVRIIREAWPAPELTCGSVCWGAKGLTCICSCGGRAHGRGAAGREIAQSAPPERWVRTVLRRDAAGSA